mmetsp:Transcript_4647/g.14816  ORF Transcript_4647/g.14816 Transcript_4647/m.14816 type:complete len:268 (-) Transcript_4647:55-858(-)
MALEAYNQGLSALEAWCRDNPEDIDQELELTVLSSGGLSETGSMLLRAIRNLNIAAMNVLLRHGADPFAKMRVDHPFHNMGDGNSAIHLAARTEVHNRDEEASTARVIELLLDAGVDVDTTNPRGTTALMFAAHRDHLSCVKLLLSRNADVFHRNNQGDDAQSLSRVYPIKYAVAEFLAEVKKAGGWRPYVTAPRLRLVVLRALCDRRRATPPGGVLARAFALPQDVLWYVLAFWRHDRDYLGPNSYAANREFELWRDDRNYLFPDS